ncbi:uncharacterized protein [Dysidea avara]|uniref:uncharacterized protein isoform X2 n=1 Tax=Dysidea avara TaxID=196820 RepID=UPI0033327801
MARPMATMQKVAVMDSDVTDSVPSNYQTVAQHLSLKSDIAVMLEVENHNISELRSKVMIIRRNTDEVEKKLTLILQELDKYSSEVKSFISRKKALENKATQLKEGKKVLDPIGRIDTAGSVPVTTSTPIQLNNLSIIDIAPSMTSTTSVSTSPRVTSIGATCGPAGIKMPRKLLNHKDLSELRSCYDDIIKNMPDNYYETVQLLERELCDTHISSIFECSHFTAANQIIMECLMERVNCKADTLDLCERLSLLKNAPRLTQIIENLRMAVVQNLQEVHQQTTPPSSGRQHPPPQVVTNTRSSQQSSTTVTSPASHSTKSTTRVDSQSSQAMETLVSSVMGNLPDMSGADESQVRSMIMSEMMKQIGSESMLSAVSSDMMKVVQVNPELQQVLSTKKSINARGFYVYTEEDKKAAMASFEEHHDLMMMMDASVISEKLVEINFFPGNAGEHNSEQDTQIRVILKGARTIISANGAAKFIDFVEVIIKQEQYDELGNHMIEFYKSSGAHTIPEELIDHVTSLSRAELIELMQFHQRQLSSGGAATMSIAQKMVNKEWVTLDDIASCGEVRGKKPEKMYIQRLVVKTYARYWKQIGRQLGIDSAVLDSIEVENATHQKTSHSCCTNMMNKWLEKETSTTWEKLLDAILAVINSTPSEIVFQPAPPLPSHCIKRQSILQAVLDTLLHNEVDTAAQVTVALTGMGGIGKSTLAKLLCHQPCVQKQFLSGFLWIKIGPVPVKPFNLLSQLYLNLTRVPWSQPIANEGREVTEEESVATLSEELNILCKNHSEKLLVIIDDVWETEDVSMYVKTFSGCKIILTTRRSDISASIPCSYVIPVQGMDQPEAVELLTIPEFQPLDAASIEQLNELALSVHKSPLLLNLVRGLLCQQYKAMPNRSSASIIKQAFKKLSNNGLTVFDPHSPRTDDAVNACLQANIANLSKDNLARLSRVITTITFDNVMPKSLLFLIWEIGLDEINDCCQILQSMGLISYTPLPCFSNNDDTHGIEIHFTIMQYLFDSTLQNKDVSEVIQDFVTDANFTQKYMMNSLMSIDHRVDANKYNLYLYNMMDLVNIPLYIKIIPIMIQAIVKSGFQDIPGVSKMLPQIKNETFMTLREKYRKTISFLNNGNTDQAIAYINQMLDYYLKFLKGLIGIISKSKEVLITTRFQLNYSFNILKAIPCQVKLYITMRSELLAVMLSNDATAQEAQAVLQTFTDRYSKAVMPILQDSVELCQNFVPEIMESGDPTLFSKLIAPFQPSNSPFSMSPDALLNLTGDPNAMALNCTIM